jgi:DNA-binding CsgD family transcriptional regulator
MKKSVQDLPRSPAEILTRIAAISLVSGKKQKEQIRLLSLAGMSPKDIAELIGTTANTVNVALSHLRKTNRMNLKVEAAEIDA